MFSKDLLKEFWSEFIYLQKFELFVRFLVLSDQEKNTNFDFCNLSNSTWTILHQV